MVMPNELEYEILYFQSVYMISYTFFMHKLTYNLYKSDM